MPAPPVTEIKTGSSRRLLNDPWNWAAIQRWGRVDHSNPSYNAIREDGPWWTCFHLDQQSPMFMEWRTSTVHRYMSFFGPNHIEVIEELHA